MLKWVVNWLKILFQAKNFVWVAILEPLVKIFFGIENPNLVQAKKFFWE